MPDQEQPVASGSWDRFSGPFASSQLDATGPCDATFGILDHQCGCCERRYVVLASVDEEGREIAVALHAGTALQVAARITEIATRQLRATAN